MTKARKCPTCGRKTIAKRESGCCSICEKKVIPRNTTKSKAANDSATARALRLNKLINSVMK